MRTPRPGGLTRTEHDRLKFAPFLLLLAGMCECVVNGVCAPLLLAASEREWCSVFVTNE